MYIAPEEEEFRTVSLDHAIKQAEENGMSQAGTTRLTETLAWRFNPFKRALRGDPPAMVEQMTATLKPGTRPAKAKARVYSPAKAAWLTGCMTALLAMGMGVRNMQDLGQPGDGGAQVWLRRRVLSGQRLQLGEFSMQEGS